MSIWKDQGPAKKDAAPPPPEPSPAVVRDAPVAADFALGRETDEGEMLAAGIEAGEAVRHQRPEESRERRRLRGF